MESGNPKKVWAVNHQGKSDLLRRGGDLSPDKAVLIQRHQPAGSANSLLKEEREIATAQDLERAAGGIRLLCAGIIVALMLLGTLRVVFTKGSLSTSLAVAGLMLCNGSMLVLNKLSLSAVPAPAFLLACQYGFCAFSIRSAGGLSLVDVEPLQYEKVKAFSAAALGMVATMFMNMKVLEHVNVDTLILFRSCTPLLTIVLDNKLLGREWPSRISFFALLGIFMSASGFLYFEAASIRLQAYLWIGLWLFFLLFDTFYIKVVMNNVSMSAWTRAYYTNIIGLLPCMCLSGWESKDVISASWHPDALPTLLVFCACVLGTALSYFSFHVRAEVSTTSFLLVGHVCKILSILLNVLIWNMHATPAGLGCLGVCIACTTCYKEAPMRKDVAAPVDDKKKAEKAAEPKATNR